LEKIVIAVGSTRSPKLNAVRQALKAFGPVLHPGSEFEVVGVEVPSGVRHTPLSSAEIRAGARARAEELLRLNRQQNMPWSYVVGLEGGLDIVSDAAALDSARGSSQRLVFLENIAYVNDGAGRAAFGSSGGILLPEPLAAQVVDAGVELSAAIDAYAGGRGIRDAQGAWGVLTRNLITREDAFRFAVINAFAPFYNAALYPTD
jgi:inosine/xanthosine triphosphatase